MNDRPDRLPIGWFLIPCGECGHLGFSHDAAAECCECPCEAFVVPEDAA